MSLPFREEFRMIMRELASAFTGNVSEFAFFCRSKQGSRDNNYYNIPIVETMEKYSTSTNGQSCHFRGFRDRDIQTFR